MPKTYKNLIFTNHAYHRLRQRSLSEYNIWQVINYYDKKYNNKFIKKLNNRQVHVIADHLNQEQKYLIISVWVRGEEDRVPVVWQLMTLPFKILYFLIKKLF